MPDATDDLPPDDDAPPPPVRPTRPSPAPRPAEAGRPVRPTSHTIPSKAPPASDPAIPAVPAGTQPRLEPKRTSGSSRPAGKARSATKAEPVIAESRVVVLPPPPPAPAKPVSAPPAPKPVVARRPSVFAGRELRRTLVPPAAVTAVGLLTLGLLYFLQPADAALRQTPPAVAIGLIGLAGVLAAGTTLLSLSLRRR